MTRVAHRVRCRAVTVARGKVALVEDGPCAVATQAFHDCMGELDDCDRDRAARRVRERLERVLTRLRSLATRLRSPLPSGCRILPSAREPRREPTNQRSHKLRASACFAHKP